MPAPVLTTALYARFSSRGLNEFSDRVQSALRKQFGGHVEKTWRARPQPAAALTARASLTRAVLLERELAQPDRRRGHLDALVGAQELERLVERQLALGHQPDELVGGRGAHVGQVLLLAVALTSRSSWREFSPTIIPS